MCTLSVVVLEGVKLKVLLDFLAAVSKHIEAKLSAFSCTVSSLDTQERHKKPSIYLTRPNRSSNRGMFLLREALEVMLRFSEVFLGSLPQARHTSLHFLGVSSVGSIILSYESWKPNIECYYIYKHKILSVFYATNNVLMVTLQIAGPGIPIPVRVTRIWQETSLLFRLNW